MAGLGTDEQYRVDTLAIPKAVAARIPQAPDSYATLQTSLQQLGLEHLLAIPWNVELDSYLQDFVKESMIAPEFRQTIRARPSLWTVEQIAHAFRCPSEGEGLYSKKKDLSTPYFSGIRNLTNGWNLTQCTYPNLRVLLEFLVPILHPKKPTICPVALANTIVAAHSGAIQVNWALLIFNVMKDQVKSMKASRPTYLQVYLSQLYQTYDCLHSEERTKRGLFLIELGIEEDISMEEPVDAISPASNEPSVAIDMELEDASVGGLEASPVHNLELVQYSLNNLVYSRKVSVRGRSGAEGEEILPGQQEDVADPSTAVILRTSSPIFSKAESNQQLLDKLTSLLGCCDTELYDVVCGLRSEAVRLSSPFPDQLTPVRTTPPIEDATPEEFISLTPATQPNLPSRPSEPDSVPGDISCVAIVDDLMGMLQCEPREIMSVVSNLIQRFPVARIPYNSGPYPYSPDSNYEPTEGPPYIQAQPEDPYVRRDFSDDSDPPSDSETFGSYDIPLIDSPRQGFEDIATALKSNPNLVAVVTSSTQTPRNAIIQRMEPRTSREQVQQYVTTCKIMHANRPPVGEFWRYYFLKKTEASYIFDLRTIGTSRVELAQFDEFWTDSFYFRPILAVMMLQGDLEVEDPDLILAYLGNFAAYVLDFVISFLMQSKKSDALQNDHIPRGPKVILHSTSTLAEKQRIWNNATTQRLAEFNRYFRDVTWRLRPFYSRMMSTEDFLFHYPRVYAPTCNHLDVIGIYREAIRIDRCFLLKRMPLMYPERQMRCLPYSRGSPRQQELMEVTQAKTITLVEILEPDDIRQQN